MHVGPRREGLDQAGVAREVGDDPQLDLVVVGHQELPALGGHERPAEPPPRLGAHRDVVEVGPLRGQPAGAGHRLAERGVDAAVGGHLGQQALAVGGAQLLHLAVAQQGVDDGVVVAQGLQGGGVGRVAGLGLASRGEAELVVEHGAQLRGRVHVELVAGQRLDLGLQPLAVADQLVGDARSSAVSTADAGHLHAGQHPHQRELHLVVEGEEALRLQPDPQWVDQPARQGRFLGRRDGPAVDRTIQRQLSGRVGSAVPARPSPARPPPPPRR